MADQFCLRWNNFQTNIVSALESLKCSEDLVDVTLTCEGRNIRAHKVILSACSPYFRTVFKENPCQHPVIILKDVLAEDIVSLLSYMYQGEVFIEESKLTSFLHTAALLQVKGLTGVPQQNRESFTASTAPITTNKLYTQLTISSNTSPFNAHKECKPSSAPKKRRSSTSDKPNNVNSFDAHKKSRLLEQMEQPLTAAGDHAEPILKTENHLENKDIKSDHTSNTNGNTLNPQLAHTSKDSSVVTVKREVEEEEDPPARDSESGNEKENESLPDYENSMLARSLLSGINPSKSDINANNSSPKSKMSLKVDGSAPNWRDTVAGSPAFPNAKKSPAKVLPVAEEQIKWERQSPLVEVELEPEVLISEQGEGGAAEGPGEAAGGASTSHGLAPQQSNHAAICGDCPHCGMKYSNQSALKYHVRLMHSDLTNRLCCYLCPRSFTMRETFKEHMWSTHGQRN